MAVHPIAIFVMAAAEVDLYHAVQRQRCEKLRGIIAMIYGVGIDVMQIEQQTTILALDDFRKELRFGQVARQGHHIGDVF